MLPTLLVEGLFVSADRLRLESASSMRPLRLRGLPVVWRLQDGQGVRRYKYDRSRCGAITFIARQYLDQ